MKNHSSKLILALDVDSLEKAGHFVAALSGSLGMFKIGSVLFTAFGPRVIELVKASGSDVFLDLKYHDIPNTVANAVRMAVRLGVRMLTLHTAGGREMLEAAVNACRDESCRLKVGPPLLLGVTVLTSQSAAPETVLALAREGLGAGLDGVVCSPQEIRLLRENIPGAFVIVTPGIRPLDASVGDQKRVATPGDALRAGADFLVVGRPILEADDPLKAAAAILKEMESAG